MPNSITPIKKSCQVGDEASHECTPEELCPGWKDTAKKLALDTDVNKVTCRPCEPGKEAWVALEYYDNFGVSWCLPPVVETAQYFGNELGAVLLMAFLWLLWKIRRSAWCRRNM